MPVTRLLFEFLILTAARSGEDRGALWCEIDSEARTWTIPGSDPITGRRMKSGVSHVVPLSGRALQILCEARKLHDGPVVFPGKKGQPLSDSTVCATRSPRPRSPMRIATSGTVEGRASWGGLRDRNGGGMTRPVAWRQARSARSLL